MKREFLLFFVAGIFCFNCTACEEEVNPLPSLELSSLVRDVSDAQDFYMNSRSPEAGATLEARQSRRNAYIVSRFKKFESTRTEEYSKYRCRFAEIHVRCKNSRPGESKTCPQTTSSPTNQVFIKEKTTLEGTNVGGPVYSDNLERIEWFVKETGKGVGHGRLNTWTKYSGPGIIRQVAMDVLTMRHKLASRGLPDGY